MEISSTSLRAGKGEEKRVSLPSALLRYSHSLSPFHPVRSRPPMPSESSRGSKRRPKMPWRKEIPRARPSVSAGPPCWLLNSASSLTHISRLTGPWSICFGPRSRCIAPWHCFNRAESEHRSHPESARYSPWAGNVPPGHCKTIPSRPRARLFMNPFAGKPWNGWKSFRTCNRNGIAGRRRHG